MWVTKYSWKQRRWRAGAPIEELAELEGLLGARLQVRQIMGGLPVAVDRRTDGFHMLSLAAKDALCCWYGNYVMVGNGARDGCWRSSRPGRSDVPEEPQLRIPHLQPDPAVWTIKFMRSIDSSLEHSGDTNVASWVL